MAKQVEQAQAQIQELIKTNQQASPTPNASVETISPTMKGLDLERIIAEAATAAASVAAKTAVENYISHLENLSSTTPSSLARATENIGPVDMSFGEASNIDENE